MNKSDSKTQESIDHTQETASRALSQVLLSRFLLLGLLVEEVQAVEEEQRLPWLEYRRLWVLLQAQPKVIFGRTFFFNLLYVSDLPRRLDDLFRFRYDFDKTIDWKLEEFELVTLSRPEGGGQPHISIVTPDSGPSFNIGFQAATGEDVLSYPRIRISSRSASLLDTLAQIFCSSFAQRFQRNCY